MSFQGGRQSVRDYNIELLRTRFPDVRLEWPTRNGRILLHVAETGDPTIQVVQEDGHRVWVHSRFDPRTEGEILASRWTQGEGLYIILGLGLGYHVHALLRRLPAGSRILIAEPDRELFEWALESVYLSDILQHEGVRLVVGDELELVRELQRLGVAILSLQPRICVHPVLARVLPDVYRRWQDVIRGEFNRILLDTATTIYWDLTWGKNTMENLPQVLASYPGKRLFDKFRGVPCVIVSAGPSLDRNADALHAVLGRALVIAVGTALKALRFHGVNPNLIVSYDGGEGNYRHFQGECYDDIPLVYDPMIYPAIPREHGGKKWIIETTSNPFMRWLREPLGSPGVVASGGSVATVALDLAVRMGCNPLILVGQDLAFREGHTHARGTVYEDRQIEESSFGASPQYMRVPAVDGGTVWTSRAWYGFLTWFERYIAAAPSHLRFIDATEGGALIRGTEVMPLRDAIRSVCRFPVPVREILELAMREPSRMASASELRTYLEEGANSLRTASRIARRAAEWAEEAETLAKLGKGDSGRMRRLLKALDRADHIIQRLDPHLLRLIELSAYASALRVVRMSGKTIDGNTSNDTLHAAPALERSRELYEAVATAAKRTAETISGGINVLNELD